jgi:hypothetical protein
VAEQVVATGGNKHAVDCNEVYDEKLEAIEDPAPIDK